MNRNVYQLIRDQAAPVDDNSDAPAGLNDFVLSDGNKESRVTYVIISASFCFLFRPARPAAIVITDIKCYLYPTQLQYFYVFLV